VAECQTFLSGRVSLFAGDCLEVLPTLPENSVDSVVCDPPYHLTANKPGGTGIASLNVNSPAGRSRIGTGFMGKQWDGGDVAFQPETWAAVLRVLKPGGHLVAFGADKNYHRLACAIEDAGFEIRHMILYLYGSGFPKSLNVGKKLDATQKRCSCSQDLRGLRNGLDAAESVSSETKQNVLAGMQRETDINLQQGARSGDEDSVRALRRADLQSAIPPGSERKNVLQPLLSSEGSRGTSETLCRQHEGAARPSGVRRKKSGVEGRSNLPEPQGELRVGEVRPLPGSSSDDGAGGRLRYGAPTGDGRMDRAASDTNGVRPSHRPRTFEQSAKQLGTLARQSQSQAGGAWENCSRCGKPIVPDGLGSALKPAYEPICLARKPLSEATIAANVLRWGCGAINIDGCRVEGEPWSAHDATGLAKVKFFTSGEAPIIHKEPHSLGRWPANVIHDGSDEVLAGFPDAPGQQGEVRGSEPSSSARDIFNGLKGRHSPRVPVGDSGSAARFFYSAKADAEDRIGSKHPTVKPLDLMQYLVRLVTPPKGVVLDCFAGSGTTAEAAWREGFSAVLIEREPEYLADIERRMSLCLAGPDERARASIKARQVGKPADHGPLFGDAAA